ncbi:MAG TPA: exodeoxyribonuclease III [archaeon]|nr:exodeoxyribonuclease III [archaeon]
MKIISWNVNGIRAVMQKNFLEFVENEKPDILCVQETKAHPDQVDEMLKDYEHYWNAAEKKGYAGTAVFTKKKPLSVAYDMEIKEHGKEGRVIALEFEDFILVNVYTPNSQRGLTRLKYREKWDEDFLKYLKKLEKNKPVIVCGDFNVAHKEIDLANPKSNAKNAGFTPEERAGFDKLVENDFVDSFREFNKEPKQYTWWSYMFNARKKNIGWRIDYFLVSKNFMKRVKKTEILDKVMGSDHCPVKLTLN